MVTKEKGREGSAERGRERKRGKDMGLVQKMNGTGKICDLCRRVEMNWNKEHSRERRRKDSRYPLSTG